MGYSPWGHKVLDTTEHNISLISSWQPAVCLYNAGSGGRKNTEKMGPFLQELMKTNSQEETIRDRRQHRVKCRNSLL